MNNKETAKELLTDPLLFTQYYLPVMQNKTFIVGEHHKKIATILKQVLTLNITRLIINLPPRYSKTEMIKMFMGMGFALNPSSKFIYTSYSEKLALDTSDYVRRLVKQEEYKELFDIEVVYGSDNKSAWYTEQNGGVYATSTKGQITGFGAGGMQKQYFEGALIIDDPIKPVEANSTLVREQINKNYDETLSSRLNSETTPIIVIMQRLHENDLTGYLLNKSNKWYHLKLSALKENNEPLWDFKQSKEQLMEIRRTMPFVFYPQYQQEIKKVKSGGEFLESFELDKHIKPLEREDKQIHISIDNNLLPYCAISVWQVDSNGKGYKAKQIKELPAIDPDNSAPGAGKIVKKYLESIEYNDTVFVYGDPSTQSKSTINEEKKSFIQLFLEQLKDYRTELRMWKRNVSVSNMGAFVNACLSGEVDIDIEIDENCKKSINDYVETKKDINGGILKKRVTDSNTKQSYEENGHFTDTFKDFLCQCFDSEFDKYIGKKKKAKIIW